MEYPDHSLYSGTRLTSFFGHITSLHCLHKLVPTFIFVHEVWVKTKEQVPGYKQLKWVSSLLAGLNLLEKRKDDHHSGGTWSRSTAPWTLPFVGFQGLSYWEETTFMARFQKSIKLMRSLLSSTNYETIETFCSVHARKDKQWCESFSRYISFNVDLWVTRTVWGK